MLEAKFEKSIEITEDRELKETLQLSIIHHDKCRPFLEIRRNSGNLRQQTILISLEGLQQIKSVLPGFEDKLIKLESAYNRTQSYSRV